MKNYFDNSGYPMPIQINPAEFVLDLISTDFSADKEKAESRLSTIHSVWDASNQSSAVDTEIRRLTDNTEKEDIHVDNTAHPNFVITILFLLQRAFIKSYRDVVAYGVRIVMYLGMYNETCMSSLDN